MMSKKWLRPIWISAMLIAILAVYVGLFKNPLPGRFFVDLSNSMFLWGLTLLCVSLIYVTRFFGFLAYFQNWFRFRPLTPTSDEEAEPEAPQHEDTEKRDPSLVYASLLLIALSIPIYYI
ncbi:hypothetical protein [Effusibacillus consociatus]|uniref:DUF3899 domain-containing protein n=1 Tax=Effusibacillus consociatus TaxID=1117041 RepID=A0ABV9PWM0_9BACL